MTYPEFKARYALTPDPQQEAAILRAEGPTLLLAVPGSGKTTTLVTRLGYLIHCLGVEPGRILTVTYTVAAAGDMKRRFAALFGEEHAGALAFRTINGICQSIISYYAWAKGAEPFALWTNEGELNALVRWLMQSHGAEWPGEQEVKEVRTRITCCKNGMLRDEEVRAIEMDGVDFPAVYFGYREYLERNRRMDYDDQMVFALRILRRYPDILAHFQSKYPYLCVDEAQDTSKIQHAILRLLFFFLCFLCSIICAAFTGMICNFSSFCRYILFLVCNAVINDSGVFSCNNNTIHKHLICQISVYIVRGGHAFHQTFIRISLCIGDILFFNADLGRCMILADIDKNRYRTKNHTGCRHHHPYDTLLHFFILYFFP